MGKAQLKEVIKEEVKQPEVKISITEKKPFYEDGLFWTRVAVGLIFLIGILMYFFF